GKDWDTDYALRVLADHVRGMTFLVLDGVIPGTGGRDYVLRRIVRRAIRYGRRLGIDRPFLPEMVEAVVERMRAHYPDLQTEATRIKQVLSTEEELFSRTLQSGTAQVERVIAETQSLGEKRVSGRDAFDLYQTYGFPVELTEEIVREAGLDVDREGFDQELEAERRRAREAAIVRAHEAGDTEFARLPRTEPLAWTATEAEAGVLGIGGTQADARLVLEATPFYAEGGGQVGDVGAIRTPSGVFVVEDTRDDGAGHIVHYGQLQGEIRPGDTAHAEVDRGRRDRSRRHHTATHLLHRALKDILGPGTSQQGSYVGPDLLRFDFNYPRALDREQLQAVAAIINDRSMDDLPVTWEIVPLQQASQMGAIMMFGEKYGDQVRVVSIGDYSRELCGGTHTHHSGELGAVTIASESGIGSGRRRVVAYAGPAALHYLNQRLQLLESLAQKVGARNPEEVVVRLDALLAEMESLRKDLQRRQQQQASNAAGALADNARVIAGVKVVAASVDGASGDDLARLVDSVRQELRSGVVVLAGAQNGRIPLVVGVTADLKDRVHAGNLVQQIARAADGGGGGNNPEFARGQGTNPAKLGAALQHAYTFVEQALEQK
ncbi:MAG: alanine--tRNA ligase, partial [Chloroflexi bacterium]|nr:alanine--tRNA ligase [Chloroflexota bacterium]